MLNWVIFKRQMNMLYGHTKPYSSVVWCSTGFNSGTCVVFIVTATFFVPFWKKKKHYFFPLLWGWLSDVRLNKKDPSHRGHFLSCLEEISGQQTNYSILKTKKCLCILKISFNHAMTILKSYYTPLLYPFNTKNVKHPQDHNSIIEGQMYFSFIIIH